MNQNVRKPGQRQLLGQVRALCVGWKISEAKHILLKEAKLNEDASFINYDEIRRSAKNKTLPLMADIVETFSDLQDYYNKDDPDDYDSLKQISNLNKILPLMTNEQKIHCYKNLAICHENYHPGNHIIQAEICRSIVKLAPREKSDSTLYSVMLKAKHLRISAELKYEIIKAAYRKISDSEIFNKEYRETLRQVSRDYYRQLINRGKEPGVPFEAREKSFRTAYYLINETGLDRARQCSMRVYLLKELSGLYYAEYQRLSPLKNPEDRGRKFVISQKLQKTQNSLRAQIHLSPAHKRNTAGYTPAFDRYR